jgi:ribokinase
MMKKVLVIGSANVDQTIFLNNFPKEKETVIGKELITSFGGKGLNQAYALKKAGVDVSFAFAIGDDSNGTQIKEFIERSKIEKFCFKYENINSGHATILVNNLGENKIVIIPGSNFKLSVENLKCIEEKMLDFEYIVIQNEINVVVNKYIIDFAKNNGIKILYNPAPFISLDKKMLNGIEILTPNEVELSQLTNTEIDINSKESLESACKMLLDYGVKNIIVTLGAKGAFYMNNEVSYFVAGKQINAIDTVSAGDTFNAYLLYSILNNYDFLTAIKIANSAAAITCTRKGSLISIPSIEEIY